jgi:putative membrane protein
MALSLCCGGALAQTTIPPAPADFAAMASQSDHHETLAAEVALIQAQDPRIRAFAETMLRDHARTAEDFRKVAMAAGLPPPGLSRDEAALLSALQGARGHDFDRAYARQQVVAHAAAVAVEESFADAGANPVLRAAAKAGLPVIRDHLLAARQLLKDVGGGTDRSG